ncbi:phage portal protein [Flavobacterium johnsoniae]|uniref:Phage portal protein, HK97 family n=1 Tax=Flavobacterium johnsoniae TaxID=986 RepID=A0A1M5IHY0_FLAJO|nr:phage portal protein [Flavobacterium johnsoniae]SHG27871.1 phage portal protein, HK97 family [Flavobacterium johnsoniae]
MSILESAFSRMFSSPQERGVSTLINDFSPYFSYGGIGTSNIKVKESLKLAAVFNAVEQISNDLAKTPFALYQDINGNKERLVNHSADFIVSKQPNYLMTPYTFKKLIGVSLPLRGNCLFEIISYNNGYPESVKYIPWDDVTDVVLSKGEMFYYVNGYSKPLMSSEVLHFKQFSLNGLVGISTITFACMQLNLALKTQEFATVNLDNKGVRQGVVETDKVIKDKPGIVKAWRAAMGEKSADRVVVLDEGMKFNPITITPQELQIIEQQKFNIEDIARWFNIAPHKIKSLEQSTNNNIEQQSLDHVSDTIQPLVTNIEQEFTKKLLSSKERTTCYFKGNINVLLRADIKSRGEYYSKMGTIGVYSRNEIRRKEDENNGPDLLDEYLTPTNTYTEKQIENNLRNSKNEKNPSA